VGGVVLLAVDKMRFEPRYHDAMDFSIPMALAIGFAQCLAMIPGVSRSGSSIVGALLLGADKRSATEFSFFLAMPTMAGAFAYDLYKNGAHLSSDNLIVIAVGFIMSLVRGQAFPRLRFGRGFSLFAWWRLIVGALGLIGLVLWK
jgi:undecaprenyl-diphosphatase